MDPVRVKKAEALRASGKVPYAATFDRSHTLADARSQPDGTTVCVAGRIMLFRDMGKMTFVTLQDHTGRLQLVFREEDVGADAYKDMLALLDRGDFIGAHGERFATKTGEPSVAVREWMMLSKALLQPPEKWHGIADRETAYRQRYLDLISNDETRQRFFLRSLFIRRMREFYWTHDFVEVDLPVLVNAASGALATPFTTHHEALDLDVYLRIALETHQKECLVGGYDRTFSLGPVFRNEGMDPSHLQEFTMCEHYAAYWDYRANMAFTRHMFETIIPQTFGTSVVKIPNREGKLVDVDFAGEWKEWALDEAIEASCGIDVKQHDSAGALREAIKSKGIKLEVNIDALGRGNLIDQLYKKVCRPDIVQPTFITRHPLDLSPLARRNDDNPSIVDRFQLVVGGWEVVNAYSELVDPMDQAQRFEEQAKANAGGDADAHRKDDEYVQALSYGCPPCSGWGMGIDRILALLTQQENLRDVVLFPILKPQHQQASVPAPVKKEKTVSLPPAGAGLLQHAEYGHLLPGAHGLLQEHTNQTKAHLVATGAAMEALAARFGGDAATWKVAGMLHDLDWDKLEKDAEEHCGKTLEQLLATIKAPQELLGDIRAHYAHKYGADYPLDTMLRKALYCVDELTGFIIAVTLVRPSKKIADVEVSSVKKKLKDKTFAAQVDREQIKKCEELLGVPLDEFVGIVLEAMKTVANEMGL